MAAQVRMTREQRMREARSLGLVGPQREGGRYFCGYWQQEYTVDRIRHDEHGEAIGLDVTWADGHQTSHCTAWDKRRDRVVAQP